MNNIQIADILKLPVQERIHLVELIWDSVTVVPDEVKVSDEILLELQARLLEFEDNRDTGYSWDQVKLHLKNKSWLTV